MMDENKKASLIAEAENIEAIRDFFFQWWSVADLYETFARATIAILGTVRNQALDDCERKDLQDLLEQHLMLIDLIKPFEKKEGEV